MDSCSGNDASGITQKVGNLAETAEPATVDLEVGGVGSLDNAAEPATVNLEQKNVSSFYYCHLQKQGFAASQNRL